MGETLSGRASDTLSDAGRTEAPNTLHDASAALARLSIDREVPFPFLKLPREVRDMIYNESLITEVEIVAYPEHYEKDDLPSFGNEKPRIALLQVNRLIYQETVPVFYGKNTFRMPANVQHNTTFIKYSAYIRHVSIRIDHREVSEQQKLAIALDNHQKPDTDFAPVRPHAARWRHIHKSYFEKMQDQWEPRRLFLMHDMSPLETIKLDLQHFYCPSLCCRIDPFYSNLFKRFIIHSRAWFHGPGRRTFDDHKVEVHGLYTDAEKDVVRSDRWAPYAKLPNGEQ